MSCKSALYTAMQTPTAIPVDGILPLGSIIRRYGCDANLNGNAVNITNAGYYDVDVSVTVAPHGCRNCHRDAGQGRRPHPRSHRLRCRCCRCSHRAELPRRWCASPAALPGSALSLVLTEPPPLSTTWPCGSSGSKGVAHGCDDKRGHAPVQGQTGAGDLWSICGCRPVTALPAASVGCWSAGPWWTRLPSLSAAAIAIRN